MNNIVAGKARLMAFEIGQFARRGFNACRIISSKQRRSLFIALGVIIVASASNTVVAIALGRIIDDVATRSKSGASVSEVYRYAGVCLAVIAGAIVVRECLNVLRRYLVNNACSQMTAELNLRLAAHVMQLDLNKLSSERLGVLHARMGRSVDGLVRFLRLSFLDFVPAAATGVIAIVTAITKVWLLGVVMIGVIPIAVLLTMWQIASEKGVRLNMMRDCEEIDGLLIEQLSGIEYIRAAHTHREETKRLGQLFKTRSDREVRHHFRMSLFGFAKAMNEGFFYLIVLAMSIYMAIHGQISYGDVLTFSVLFVSVMAPLAEIHRVMDEGHEASLRVGELMEMFAEPVDCSFQTPAKHDLRLVAGEPVIEVDDLAVDYHIPHHEEAIRALDGISMRILHGETIGVVGRSGCGKSTWLKVLLRLTHPQRGRILLGQIPLEAVHRESIGQFVGYVGQLPFVFSGTIAENIAYANPGATIEEIRSAAESANLHEEIMNMPGAYEAQITEHGQNLSGGQRQRLSIARVFLKKPKILILDEATSAIDTISERHVQHALGLGNHDRTTILVAHRLSSLRDADRIVVFDQGRIVEVGAYDDLLHRNGLFTDLASTTEHAEFSQTP